MQIDNNSLEEIFWKILRPYLYSLISVFQASLGFLVKTTK